MRVESVEEKALRYERLAEQFRQMKEPGVAKVWFEKAAQIKAKSGASPGGERTP